MHMHTHTPTHAHTHAHTEMVWVSLDWANMEVYLYGEKGVYDLFGKEPCLVTLSHRGDLDWVGGYIVATHFNFLHVSVINCVCVCVCVCACVCMCACVRVHVCVHV